MPNAKKFKKQKINSVPLRTTVIGWVKQNLMFADKVGGWVKKRPKILFIMQHTFPKDLNHN